MKVTLYRLEAITREGRRLAELLDEPAPSEVWKDMSVKASDLYARVTRC